MRHGGSSNPVSQPALLALPVFSALVRGGDSHPPRLDALLFSADDPGDSALGCYGSAIETPNLAEPAREDLRFTL